MQSLGGAVIPMQINSEKIKFLVGDAEILEGMENIPALPMFSEQMVSFLGDLSKTLMKDKRTRDNTDVMAYAYWIRKSSIVQAKQKYYNEQSRIGRGVAFHVAPSNVPVNFAVSMTSSLLAGNGCIIRVSSKPFIQVDIICAAINQLLSSEHKEMKPYFCIVQYEYDEEITKCLSSMCDLRIIWGGDKTIEQIRMAPLPPRAVEMTFADRHSIAVIDADEYLKQDADEVAKGFYTDTYYTDQNACSSPRLVVWMGKEKEKAREQFWHSFLQLVKADYPMQPIQSVDKYAMFTSFAMKQEGIRLISEDNYMVRIEVEQLTEKLLDSKFGGGYFFEYEADELMEIVPVLSKRCQTIAVLGIDKNSVRDMVFRYGVRGVDRIVSLGQTMGLEFIWDGYNMIEAMTRLVYVGS